MSTSRPCVPAVVLALLVPSCTFLQPRQVVIHAVASEPSEKARYLPPCDQPSAWEATAGVLSAGLDALVLSQCRLCQLGYVLGRVGLVGGGVAAEWMQRAQTNKMAAHRVAVPLGRDEGAPLVLTVQSPDGTLRTLIIPQRSLDGAGLPGIAVSRWHEALLEGEAARRPVAERPAR